MVPTQIKICGLRSRQDVENAVDVDANFLGMVHYPGSTRHLELSEMTALARIAPARRAVAVIADPEDGLLCALTAAADWRAIQLHGGEEPERVAAIAERCPGVEVWKAVPVAAADDVSAWRAYRDSAARIVFDARPPKATDAPGGQGRAFDWSLLTGADLPKDWILAGGLDAANVADAVRMTAAPAVDVSSGVELRAGVKELKKMRAFVHALGR